MMTERLFSVKWHDVIESEGKVFIPSDETWREMVLEAWADIGGRRQDMLDVFSMADRQSHM